jgi:4-amino-4-deoxy-L-arabinose transferase-like glycosyltransferase
MTLIARSTAIQLGLVLLIPVCVFLIAYATGFNGLAEPAAMHDAQLARSLAEGSGFYSASVTPLRLLFDTDPRSPRKPDVSTPPAGPAFLAIVFVVFGPSDSAAALASGIAYVVSVAVVFLLLLRLASSAQASLGAAAYALALPIVRQSLSGTNTLLATCLLGAAFLLLLRLTADADVEAQTRVSPRSDTKLALATGAVFGVTCLTEFYLAPVVLLMGAYLYAILDRPRAGRLFGRIALGAVLIIVPWLARNAIVTRMPLFTMRQYDLIAGSWAYPGRTVFQTLDPSLQWPPLYALSNPKTMARKIVYNMGFLREELPGLGDSVLAAAFLGGLLLPFGRRRMDALRICIFGAVLLQVLVGCALTRSPAMFLPLLPVGWALALTRLSELVQDIAERDWWSALPARLRLLHAGTAAALIAAVACPSVGAIVSEAPLTVPRGPSTAFIADKTLPHEFIMTDVPWQVAWETERTAIDLCLLETEVAIIDGMVPLGGVYLSRDPGSAPTRGRGLWWQIAFRSEGPSVRVMWRMPGAPPGAVWRRRSARLTEDGNAQPLGE